MKGRSMKSFKDGKDYQLLLKFKNWLRTLDVFEQIAVLGMVILTVLVLIWIGE